VFEPTAVWTIRARLSGGFRLELAPLVGCLGSREPLVRLIASQLERELRPHELQLRLIDPSHLAFVDRKNFLPKVVDCRDTRIDVAGHRSVLEVGAKALNQAKEMGLVIVGCREIPIDSPADFLKVVAEPGVLVIAPAFPDVPPGRDHSAELVLKRVVEAS